MHESRTCLPAADIATGNRRAVSVFLELTYHSDRVVLGLCFFFSRREPRRVLSKSRLRQTGYRGDIPVAAHPAVHSDAELSPRSGYKGN